MKDKRYKPKATRAAGIYRTPPTRNFLNGGWEVRYREDARTQKRKVFRTKQDALDFQADFRTKKREGNWINPAKAKIPFSEIAQAWYETTADLRPSTRRSYRLMLDAHILPAFGNKAIGGIEVSHVRAFVADLKVSPKTKRNVLLVLSPIFKLAVEDKCRSDNPLRRGMAPKVTRPEMKVLTADQVSALAEAIPPEYRTLVYFAAFTGARAGEIAALRVRDLDLLRGRVTIARSLSRVDGQDYFLPPKNGKVRAFNIPRFLVEMLAAHLSERPHDPDDLVFTGERGGPFRHSNFYNRQFKRALREAGLPDIRFHDLRHTHVSLLVANNVHAKAISERLGHSSIAITMDRYGHLFSGHEDVITEGLEETFKAAAANGGLTAADVVPIR